MLLFTYTNINILYTITIFFIIIIGAEWDRNGSGMGVAYFMITT